MHKIPRGGDVGFVEQVESTIHHPSNRRRKVNGRMSQIDKKYR